MAAKTKKETAAVAETKETAKKATVKKTRDEEKDFRVSWLKGICKARRRKGTLCN